MPETLLSVHDLKVHFPSKGALVRAVDGVSFDIPEGETLGLLGESGCGKTTLGRTILRLQRATSGEVRYRGRAIGEDARPFRRHIQMIFQDPYASLDPRMTVESIIAEPIRALGFAQNGGVRPRVEHLMGMVGLSKRFVSRYPHEFSGGQRQRIGIARALAAEPDFVVADEPISALDVSIQAQILNLLERLRDELKLSYLFISHDLRAVGRIADRVAVMYFGEIVELAPARQLYAHPLMPYTMALLSALPVIGTAAPGKRMVLKGDLPSPSNPPSGCRFRTRCPYAIPACAESRPQLVEIERGHWAACSRISPQRPEIESAA